MDESGKLEKSSLDTSGLRQVWRVQKFDYHKPWRGNYQWFVTKELFEYLRGQEATDFNEIEYPGKYESDNDDDEGIYGYMERNSYDEAQTPFILMGELEFWGE